MKKMNILRGIALLLAAIMIFTSVPETALTAYAIEEEAETPAAVEPTVEQTGTGEETQVTTPEVVEPETTDDVVIDPVASGAPEATGEEVANEGATDVSKRILTVQPSSYANSRLQAFAYGVEQKKDEYAISFTVTANTEDGKLALAAGSKYTDFSFEINTAADLSGDTLNLADFGLTVEKSDNVVTIYGTPTRYLASGSYYLVFTDNATNSQAIQADAVARSYTIKIDPANMTPKTANGTTLDFGSATAGAYTVNPSLDYAAGTNLFKQVKLESTIDTTKIPAVSDVNAFIIGSDKDTLEEAAVEADSTSFVVSLDGRVLSKDSAVTATVTPSTSLKDTTVGSDTTYTGWLWIYSENGAFAPLEYPITLDIATDLALKATQTIDGEEAEGPFTLKVGDAIDDIVVKVTGGVAPYQSISLGTALPAGLTEKVDLTAGTLTISGTPTTAAGAADYRVTAVDDSNISAYTDVNITVEEASLEYSVDGEEVDGDDDVYSWFAAPGYDEGTKTRVITVNNPTATDYLLTITNTDNTTTKISDPGERMATSVFTFTTTATEGTGTDAGNYIIPAKSSIELVVTPPAYTATDDGKGATAEIKFENGSLTTGKVNLAFYVTASAAEITDPANGGDLKAATVGTTYSYKAILTKDEDTYGDWTESWAIVEGGNEDGTSGNPISAENLLKNYGIQMTSAGVFSGTPKKSGSVEIQLQATLQKAGETDVVKTSTATLVIAKAAATIVEIQDNSGVKLGKNAKLGTGSQNTESTNIANTVLKVKNSSDADLADVQATIKEVHYSAVSFDAAAAAAKDTGKDDEYFEVTGDYGDDAAVLKAKATGTFTVTEKESPKSLDAPAGYYIITVQVAGTDMLAAAEANLYLTIGQAPKLQYAALNSSGYYDDQFKLNTPYALDSKVSKRTVSPTSSTLTLTYSWEPDLDNYNGAIPDGMYIDSKTGQIYGTPTKAGVYDVVVTGKDTKSGMSGTINLRLYVEAASAIASISYKNDKNVAVELIGNEYVFNGVKTGEAAPEGLTFTVKSGATAIDGYLNISVRNVYGYPNSSQHFEVGPRTTIKGLDKNGRDFTITPKLTSVAGDYAAYVQISGDEIVNTGFFVYFAVVDPLKLNYIENKSEFEAKVGEELAWKDKDENEIKYIAALSGGSVNNVQPVAITEDIASGAVSVLKDTGMEIGGDYYNGNIVAGLNNGSSKAGEYTIPLKATAAAITDKSAADVIAGINVTSGFGAKIVNTGYTAYPELKTETSLPVKVTVNKSDAVYLESITSSIATTALTVGSGLPLDGDNDPIKYFTEDVTVTKADGTSTSYKKNVDVTLDRDDHVKSIDGFIFKAAAEGYTPETLTLVLDDDSLNDVNMKAALGTKNFEFTTTNTTITSEGTITVRPKSGLKAGTYTDTVTFTNDNVETVSLPISFTVEASDFNVTVEYNDLLRKELDENNDPQFIEHKVVDKGKGKTAASEEITVLAIAGTSTATPITITNSGNQEISLLKVYEVKDAAGTPLAAADTAKLSLTASGAGSKGSGKETVDNTTVAATENWNIKLWANSTAAADDTAYIKVEWMTSTSASANDYVIIPVHIVNYTAERGGAAGTNDLTYTPATDAGTLTFNNGDSNKEGYTINTGLTKTVKVALGADKVPSTRTADERDDVYGLKAELEGMDADAFEVSVSNYGDNMVGSDVGVYQLKTGTDVTFTVTPKTGLLAGAYSATLKISGLNADYASGIVYNLSFTVAENNASVEFPVYSTSSNTNLPGSLETTFADYNTISNDNQQAQRLYNAIVELKRAGSEVITDIKNEVGATAWITFDDSGAAIDNAANQFVGIPDGSEKVTVTLSNGLKIEFALTASDTTTVAGKTAADGTNVYLANDIESASIVKAGDAEFEEDLVLGTTAASTDMTGKKGAIGTTRYGEVTFTPYSWIKLSGTGAIFVDSAETIEALAPDKIITVEDDDDVTEIYALYKNGETIDQIFAVLPEMVKTGTSAGSAASFNGFKLGGAMVDARTQKVLKDIALVADFTSHTYPASTYNATTNPSGESEGVVWTWAEDGSAVSLTLTCKTHTSTPETVTISDVYGLKTNQGVIAITREAQDASCEKGEGYLYHAVCEYNGVTYESDYLTGDEAEAKGHKWDYDGISFTTVDEAGVPVMTGKAVCDTCGKEVAPTFTYSTKINPATCSKAGDQIYTITVYQLDVKGNPTTKVYDTLTLPLTASIPAKGHTLGEELFVEWKIDEKTGEITGVANAYLLCTTCNERVDVTAEFVKATDTAAAYATYTDENKKVYKVEVPAISDSDCVLSDPVWQWSEDYSNVTVTYTRKYGKQAAGTTSFSLTNGVTIDKKFSALNTYYTASVSITDKNGTRIDKNTVEKATGNAAYEGGIEDGFMTFGWDNVDWTGSEDETMVYTGKAIKPAVFVANGDKKLVEGTDYTVTYKNNTNASKNTKAGVASVVIKGKGNYKETYTMTFVIEPKDIGDEGDVFVGGTAVASGKKPSVAISYAGKILGKKDTDVASKFNAKLTATTTQTVLGKGNFTGEREVTVEVVAKTDLVPITASIKKGTAFTYDGTPHTLNTDVEDAANQNLFVTPKKGAGTLYEGQDYFVSYSDNVNAGTVTVYVTGAGKYTGKIKKTFKINPAKNNTVEVTNALGLSATYKRTGAEPVLVLQDKTEDSELENNFLVKGKDYKVSYSKNKKVGNNSAVAKITFIGNYKGKKAMSVPFSVTQAELTEDDPAFRVSVADYVVFNSAKPAFKNHKAPVYVELDGILLNSKEVTVNYYSETGALLGNKDTVAMSTDGKATITAKVIVNPKNANYKADSTGAEIAVTYDVISLPSGKTDVSKAKLKVVPVNGAYANKAAKIGYTGEGIYFDTDDEYRQGDIAVKIDKNTSLTPAEVAENFDVTYVNNVKRGTATIVLTAKDSSEKYSGSFKGTFKIGSSRIAGIKQY